MKLRKAQNRKPPELLTQKELVKRINKNTRKSYKYFEILFNQI